MDHLGNLLLAAQRGDVQALDRFILETQGEVWRLCRYLGDAADADDLAQETFERAIASLGRYRGDGSARGWLLTIARRVCADHVRRSQRHRNRVRAVTNEASVSSMVRPDSTGIVDLDELLDDLSAERREAFVLTQILGMYYDEAAELIGCPVGTIRSRVSRARQQLTEMMTDDDDATEPLTGTL